MLNLYEIMVIINGEDKSDIIASLQCTGDKCVVTYKSKPLKEYTYSSSKVKILKTQGSIERSNARVYYQNKLIVGFESILDFGERIRVFGKNGYTRSYETNKLRFEKNTPSNYNSRECLHYFRRIADHISVKAEDGVKILSKQYEKLDSIDEETVLSSFLSPEKPIKKNHNHELYIYPFGLNRSQRIAVQNAFSAQVSIIEGPPGTGKTQTILNIIANAILREKTIIVVSNNNSATENVLAKKDKHGLSFFAAFLGRRANKAQFINNQTSVYPDMSTWTLFSYQRKKLTESVSALAAELDEMMFTQNRIAEIDQEIMYIVCEQKHFNEYSTIAADLNCKQFSHATSQILLLLMLEIEQFAEREVSISLWMRFRGVVLYRIGKCSLYKQPPQAVISLIQKLYYVVKLQELETEKAELAKKLEVYHFEKNIQRLTEESMMLFKAELAKRFSDKTERPLFTEDDLWKRPTDLNSEYPLIFSTTYSARSSLNKDHVFDYVVIDEATQADVITGALALSCAKNAVIVGDLMQLPNVMPDSIKEIAENEWNSFDLNPAYNYAKHCLLSSALALWKDAPRSLLQEHYRCHPKIINFCNRKFYNDKLIILTRDYNEPDVLKIYKTVPGNHARGRVNQRQLDVIRDEIIPQLGSINNIGIISPYRDQTNQATQQIVRDGLEVDTVHKFQGREKDTIILTTVDNIIGKFADNPNLLNVAVSRAVSRLRLVISDHEENENTNIGDLVKYIKYNNGEIVNSKIYSVFDMLYKGYAEQRKYFLCKRRKISQYDSENLMQTVIDSVLALPEYNTLDSLVHLPLRMLIRDHSLLNEEEHTFLMRRGTHLDFVIFHTMDKQPVLVIEVDGSSHRKGTRQAERDHLKDGILAKYGIPIIRMKTTESREEERLRARLWELIRQ